MGTGDFTKRLFARVLADTHHNERGAQPNWGMARPLSARRRAGDSLEGVAGRAGLARRHFDPRAAGEALAEISALSEGLARAESLMADQESRDLLLDVIGVRVLGDKHSRLPVSQSDYRAACAIIDRDHREQAGVEATGAGHPLNRYRIDAGGGPVWLVGAAFQVHEFFGLEQYSLKRSGVSIAPEPGDVVVDGGGGWADSGLYFADAVGAEGRVLSFEFVADNLRLFELNRSLNTRLADRLEVVAHPLWSSSGETLAYAAAGGQTSVAIPAGDDLQATTITVDDACSERGVERIDFLKLDVEGAEQDALRGAERMIRRCRPKLALSVYHRDRDLAEIPAWVAELDLGYDLYLDHKWPGVAETMLFASPV